MQHIVYINANKVGIQAPFRHWQIDHLKKISFAKLPRASNIRYVSCVQITLYVYVQDQITLYVQKAYTSTDLKGILYLPLGYNDTRKVYL